MCVSLLFVHVYLFFIVYVCVSRFPRNTLKYVFHIILILFTIFCAVVDDNNVHIWMWKTRVTWRHINVAYSVLDVVMAFEIEATDFIF